MKRRNVYLFAALGAWMCFISLYHARKSFIHPSPPWMMTDAWYEELLGAVLGATILGACLIYDHRRFRMKSEVFGKTPLRWRDRPELRVVLYCLAAILFASLPLGLFKEFQSLRDDPPSWANTFLSAFPLHTIFQMAGGVAIIVYDRRRIHREAREDRNHCSACGYDLRATPDRCPECGMVPAIQELLAPSQAEFSKTGKSKEQVMEMGRRVVKRVRKAKSE